MFYQKTDLNKYTILTASIGLAIFATLETTAFAATISAEKACAVRVEGEEFQKGQRLGVYKTPESTKPVAVVLISRIDSKNPKKAVGKVVAPKLKSCASLKGLRVAPMPGKGKAATASEGESSSSGTPSPYLSKLDVFIDGGLLITSAKGTHVKADTIPSVPMQLIHVDGGADVFPMLFMGNNFIHKALGLGGRFRWGRSLQEIDVQTNEAVAKQQTSPSGFQIDGIFRIPYGKDDFLATEIRPGYFSHSLTHKLTKTVENLEVSPMRNTHFKGISIGLKQRWVPHRLLRVNAGFAYGLVSASGAKVDPTVDEGRIDIVGTFKSPAALFFDLGADIKLGLFRVGLGYARSAFSGTLESTFTDGETVTNSSVAMSETYDSVFLGIGVSL